MGQKCIQKKVISPHNLDLKILFYIKIKNLQNIDIKLLKQAAFCVNLSNLGGEK